MICDEAFGCSSECIVKTYEAKGGWLRNANGEERPRLIKSEWLLEIPPADSEQDLQRTSKCLDSAILPHQ